MLKQTNIKIYIYLLFIFFINNVFKLNKMDFFNYGILLLTQRFPFQRSLGGGSNDVMFFFYNGFINPTYGFFNLMEHMEFIF